LVFYFFVLRYLSNCQLQMLTVVYTTFFPNDETQILILDSDDIPPIPYHERELTNIGLLSTLPWLNTNKLKNMNIYNSVCFVLVYLEIYMWM